MHASAFLVAFLAWIGVLVAIGWRVSRRHEGDGDDFLLAGRGLPLLLVLGTTVATMVGTGSSIGAVGFGYAHGWAGALYGIGGAVGILLAAWWFAPVRALRFMTMSEELAYYVGAHPAVRNAVAVIILLACIGWLGAHIIGGGMYLAWIAGIDTASAKLLVAAGFGLFSIIGGYRAVVWTDTLQAMVLFAGFLLMAWLAVDRAGGWASVMAAHDAAALAPIGLLPAVSLAVVVAVGVLATPSYRQRIYSADSVSAARRSFAWSGGLYLLFSLVPAVIGMSAFALDPTLDNRNFAFPFLAMEVLPLAAGLVVVVAGLSATLSSASSDAIAGVTILLRDIHAMATGRTPDRARVVRLSRLGLVGVVGVALALALLSDDIIGYITAMIATLMSGLFACGLLGRFWPRFTWQGALAALLGGAAASLLVILTPGAMATWGNPILPSLAGAFGLGLAGSLLSPPNPVSHESALARINAERARMERD
ncbi:sodium:solute symporter family protein [Lysobacter sp. SG-8]|uniref:Sodium:solute symporter family protein n=1 Tax=Marilutibacter penaei TaxID=2759900 RepID=A0A7W3U158_9GAMM|nr:sodium:solute symporter family protein [Lysobacter penaei]MBB1086998.1 sodium:solute symporter family protein [Lysobacter penaei]